MKSSKGLVQSAKRVASKGYQPVGRTSPHSRGYSYYSVANENPQNTRNLILAGGGAIVLAGVIGYTQPWYWQRQVQNPEEANTRWTAVGGDKASTDMPGIGPNTESTRRGHEPHEITGANKNKGTFIETYQDAKGGTKKRVAAASKTPGGEGTMSKKQEGLSNTDTKYSIDLTNNPNKAQKGEGGPETAKLKGTVDSRRPLSA
ncbi:hypothetical protein GLAREA_02429 [Glarea lozoyensis ATCC 20868]|uniref:Uncharacterized protein n=1 Tax=Glarea lozoyensis (strain ATCC 20868 / MF5171) TaxID=1116229 RepID=S3D367_GLAL2|nr:uncharacterized protein GLAREA_02429 [Glarea lozoyensis ATCC 20868]EPE26516.1 hypothetical protein GLAREA_02429 [Glarea lozoyensis ATCC 20868]